MKQLVVPFSAVVLAVVAGSGCYAQTYGSAGYSTGYVGVAYSAPPPVTVETDVYYEDRPGYVYVNGRYNWYGNRWVWSNGYWETERPGHVYVQGYWHGSRWYDGRWEAQRPGYVHTGGHWNNTGRGHVWVQGNWERARPGSTYVRGRWSNNGGGRVYNRGGWSGGRGAASAPGGVIVRGRRR